MAKQLSETQAKLAELQLQDEELNTLTIQQLMREAKNDATLMKQIDTFITKKNNMQANYQDALTYIGRLYMNEEDIYRNSIYQKLMEGDRKSTRLNSSHVSISYAVFCLKKKINKH